MFKLWYSRIILAIILVCILIFMPTSVLLDIGFLGNNHATAKAFRAITLILAISSTSLLIWVVPFFASNDGSLVFKHSPRRTVKDLNIVLVVTPTIIFVCGVIVLVAPTLSSTPSIVRQNLFEQGLIFFVASIIMVVPSLLVSNRLEPRMKAMTRRRLICYECGYDLQGNSDASSCPECGAEVPKLNTCSQDHPGQGPAGHDRA